MIDYTKIRKVIVAAVEARTGYTVVMANQVSHVPPLPYLSFKITSPIIANNGTYGRYTDGIDRKPFKQVWSFTAQGKTPDEALTAAHAAHDYFDRFSGGLGDYDIGIVRIGDITNRDTMLSAEYEYRCGFDVTFSLIDEIDRREADEGEILAVNR